MGRRRLVIRPLLEVAGLSKHYAVTRGVALQRNVGAVKAVDGVDFSVARGEVFALVGETGCGKSTTGRIVAGYVPPTSGTVTLDGEPVTGEGDSARRVRRMVQLIPQDPYSSLNPRQTIGTILAAPFRYQRIRPDGGVQKRVLSLLEQVGLSRGDVHRFPAEFSGGQRQRVAIARAIALEPELIVADEPVSALDVSIRAQVVNLLEDLRQRLGTTYLFISHDLSVVRHVADHVAVMYLGKIVEIGARDELYANPRHPYTRALVSAAPVPDPRVKGRNRIELAGEVPSPLDPPSGCRFHTRCWKATERCHVEEPPLEPIDSRQWVACHHPEPAGAVVSAARFAPEPAR